MTEKPKTVSLKEIRGSLMDELFLENPKLAKDLYRGDSENVLKALVWNHADAKRVKKCNERRWISAAEMDVFLKEQENNEARCVVRAGWDGEGKQGKVLGKNIFVEQYWTPVLWDNEEDPDFCKTDALEIVSLLRGGKNGL